MLNLDDVPLNMQREWILDILQFSVDPSVANSRLTFHNFNCSDFVVQRLIPHNPVAVQSNNDWPPRLLFDVAYGCAALKTWGVRGFMKFAEETTKEFYYHDVDNDNDDSDNGHSVAGKQERVHQKKTVPGETPEKAGDSEAVDILDVVVGLWAHNARKDMRRARMMGEEQTRESIKKWLEFVA